MSICDLVDDGSFEWVHREAHSSAAYEPASGKARLDVTDGGAFARTAPMVNPDACFVRAARDKLMDDLKRENLMEFSDALERAGSALHNRITQGI